MMKHLRAHSKARTHAKLARWMGGKTAEAKADVDEGGGQPKAKRAVAQPVSVEGKAARPRLDRPGRKMGGRIKRADGGWTGEGDTGQHLRDKSASEKVAGNRSADNSGRSAMSAGMGALINEASQGIGRGSPGSRIGKILGKGLMGVGAAMTGADALDAAKHYGKSRDAADLSEKAEGRKRGGKV